MWSFWLPLNPMIKGKNCSIKAIHFIIAFLCLFFMWAKKLLKSELQLMIAGATWTPLLSYCTSKLK